MISIVARFFVTVSLLFGVGASTALRSRNNHQLRTLRNKNEEHQPTVPITLYCQDSRRKDLAVIILNKAGETVIDFHYGELAQEWTADSFELVEGESYTVFVKHRNGVNLKDIKVSVFYGHSVNGHLAIPFNYQKLTAREQEFSFVVKDPVAEGENVKVMVMTDDFPGQNTVTLTDVLWKTDLLPTQGIFEMAVNEEWELGSVSLVKGRKYRMKITDSFGDGIVGGYIKIQTSEPNSEVIFEIKGIDGDETIVTFNA